MSITDIIQPIVIDTYGDNSMSRGLVDHLAAQIAQPSSLYDSRGREYMIMSTCWNWFSGGGTAGACAKRIETKLLQHGIWREKEEA